MATNQTVAQTKERRRTATTALHKMRETFEEEEQPTQQFHEALRKRANMVSGKFVVIITNCCNRPDKCYVYDWRLYK